MDSLVTELAIGQRNAARPGRAAHTSYTVERLGEAGFRESFQPEWQALHDALTPRTPFTSPLWNVLWWKHFGGAGRWARHELFAHAVRDSGNQLIAVAPMMLTTSPAFGPLKLRAIRSFGTDPNITELRSVICRPQDEVRALERLGREFERSVRFDWIDWGAVRGTNWDELAARAPRDRLKPGAQVIDYHLPLPDSWEEFRRTRSRNIKESIRKCYNSLAREGLKPELRIVSSAAECDDALRTFLMLHDRRSHAAEMVRHANVFASGTGQAFLFDYVRAMAQAGRLRLFQLRVRDSIVATRIGFLFGDELYLYYSGYDTEWARYSIMTTLVVEAIKWAIDNRLKLVNLSTGTDVSKLRWGPAATEYRSAVQVGSGTRSRLSYAAYEWTKSRRHR